MIKKLIQIKYLYIILQLFYFLKKKIFHSFLARFMHISKYLFRMYLIKLKIKIIFFNTYKIIIV